MLAHTALRAVLLIVILLSGSFLSVVFYPSTQAEDTQGYTTLYFTNALSFEMEDDFAALTTTPPTAQEDSEYPPSILAKNGLSGENTSLLSEDWIAWLTFAWMSKYLENLSGIDFGEFGGFEGFELFFPGPYRISEAYTYEGNDTVHIRGDVLYHLYFSDTRKMKKLTDSVDVAIYTMNIEFPIPKLIKNSTVLLTPPTYLGGIYDQQITLSDVNCTLSPGDSLFVSIEIVPTNKSTLALDILNLPVIKKTFQWMVNRWENNITLGPLRRKIGALIKNVTTLFEETSNDSGINFTSEDIADFINAIKSSKLIYDSQAHPSSVTIPAKISDKDIRTYYFHPGQTMSETQQGTNTSSAEKIEITTTPKIWSMEQGLERNKILKLTDVTVQLYFYRFLCILPAKVSVTVTLYDDNTSIASTEKTLTKNELQGFFRKKKTPVVFNFTGGDREIAYDHKLGIGISLSNGSNARITKLQLQPTSTNFPSLLRVTFEETQNIQIKDVITTPSEGQIIPGGSVQYLLNVTSLKEDTLQIRTIEREKIGAWEIVTPSSVTVSANSWVHLPVFVNSSIVLNEAYGSIIDLMVVVTGNTGIARQVVIAEISEDAIEYDVQILGYSESINISKGEKRFFYFVVKNNNTGAIDDVDSYTITASSENRWPLIPQTTIRNLGIGDMTDADDARVLIEVPENATEPSDTITITVTSDSSSDASATITITVHVIGEGFIEEFLEFFDSAAQSLGLNDLFGSDGKFVLLILLVVIILFLIIILALVFTSKPVHLICTDRIKEIDLTENAIFDITLKNPYKKPQSYDIETQPSAPSTKWVSSIEPQTVMLEGRASTTIQVTATPTTSAEPQDWTKITVSVKKTGRQRKASIALMAMLKEGETLLQINNVSHWPTLFYPGEKVVTSLSVSNNGTVAARNTKVFFYLNGKQKNKVELTLPAGNIADIQIPWIAQKGKNKVRIRVKEQ